MSARPARASYALSALLVCGAAAAQQPKLPELQPGKWQQSGTNDATTCGHPLQSTYAEIEQLAKLQEMGCKVDMTAPKARSVGVAVVCPAGSKIGAVDMAFTISSPNPQSYNVEWVRRGRRETLNGVRIGDC